MEDPIENSWSYKQKYALMTTLRISSSLSILGSMYIVLHTLKPDSKRNERLQNVYNRLLLSISVCDFLSSVFSFISTWAIPADDTQTFFINNKGNQKTCDLQVRDDKRVIFTTFIMNLFR